MKIIREAEAYFSPLRIRREVYLSVVILAKMRFNLLFPPLLWSVQLDPVSRVTGIRGWYWILGIKCSDTTGVGLAYWNSALKSGQGHTPISKHRHVMHARVTFCRVGGLLEKLWVMSTFLQKERRILMWERTKMSNYLTHRYFVVDNVCFANKCNQK